MYGVIRVRGSVHTPKKIKDTFSLLRLKRVNHCAIVPETKDYKGMLDAVKHYATWGEISQETLEKLIFKRGRLLGDKRIDGNEAKKIAERIIKNNSLKELKIKPVFRLSPPSKGLRSVKISYPKGDLGYRGEKIEGLIKRML